MNPWAGFPVPAMRLEALHGDRVVRCFVERPKSFYAMLARAAAERPDAPALVCEGRSWTYAQTHAEVERVAASLAARGIARGDRVGLLIPNRPEFVFVLFALQRLGAVAVPIGVREQRPGLAYMLGQCGAKGIVFDADLAERIPDQSEAPGVTLRAQIGGAVFAAPAGAPPPVAEVHEHDAAVILYTSGTTGKPKGAVLTHLNIAHSVLHYEACMRLGADERSALAVPASHVTGLIATIASMAHVGGTVVVMPEFKAPAFIELVERERITHTLMVPAMYNLCLLAPDFGRRDLSSWRVGGYGGAPMPVATIDALARHLPNLVLVNTYGATETTSPTTMMPAGRTRDHADTVGVPLPCVQVLVMDDEGREAAPGEAGELWIGGPMVVPGYWDNAEASATSFTAGFWHSGDFGSIDAEGFVRILDRKKDMLNRGGFKIYSVEVENALMGFDGVLEAAIVARECPVLGERVHAVLHAPGVEHNDAKVRDHCRKLLADYKVPETITWSDTPLPRNANGKVLKRLLRESAVAAGAAKGR